MEFSKILKALLISLFAAMLTIWTCCYVEDSFRQAAAEAEPPMGPNKASRIDSFPRHPLAFNRERSAKATKRPTEASTTNPPQIDIIEIIYQEMIFNTSTGRVIRRIRIIRPITKKNGGE